MCLLSACLHCPYCRVTAPPLWEADCSFTRAQCLGAALTGRLSKMLVKRRLTILKRIRKSEKTIPKAASLSMYKGQDTAAAIPTADTTQGCPHAWPCQHCGKMQTQVAFCGTSVSSSGAFGTETEGFPVPKHKSFSRMKYRLKTNKQKPYILLKIMSFSEHVLWRTSAK